MAAITWFRYFIYTLITSFSITILGISAYAEWFFTGYISLASSFIPFGIALGALTGITLPLFSALGNIRPIIFTSTVLFEVFWFFTLGLLWLLMAIDATVGNASAFPGGCNGFFGPDLVYQPICNEFVVVVVFAFIIFFCTFVYFDVMLLYAIRSAVRHGNGVWLNSVGEIAALNSAGVSADVPVVQAQINPAPVEQYQNYGGYPAPQQPYNPYPQQFSPPQGSPSQQYGAYQQPGSPQSPSTIPLGQNRPYSYVQPSGAALQQVQAVNDPQAPLPLPSGYQGQPNAPHQQQSV